MQDHLELWGTQATRDLRVVRVVSEAQDLLVPQDLRDHWVLQAVVVLGEPPGLQDLWVHQVLQDHLVSREPQGSQGNPEV